MSTPDVIPSPAEEGEDQKIPIEPSADPGTVPEVAEENLVLFTIFVGSCVTMIAGAHECDVLNESCAGEPAWAICCGLFSLIFCIIMAIMNTYCGDAQNKIAPYFSVVLFIWWLFGTGIGTFHVPFKTTGNGYFAEWLSFFASLYYMVLCVPFLSRYFAIAQAKTEDSTPEAKYGGLVLVLSLVEFIAGCFECGDDECSGQDQMAIVMGITSILIVAAYIPLSPRCPVYKKFITYLLVLWWAIAAVILTFGKPFNVTGNGYFACWGAFLASVLLAIEAAQLTLPSVANKDSVGAAEPTSSSSEPQAELGTTDPIPEQPATVDQVTIDATAKE
jgi:hypothetical protein